MTAQPIFKPKWQDAALILINATEVIGGEDLEGNFGLRIIIEDGMIYDGEPKGNWEITIQRLKNYKPGNISCNQLPYKTS